MRRTPEELRSWLERRLKTTGNFGVLWQQLEQEHYIGEFRQGDIDEEEILRVSRKKLAAARELVGGQTLNSEKEDEREDEPDERYFEVDLSDYENERAHAYEEISAREAALNQGPVGSFPLKDWRRKFLGERLLLPEEAHDLLESPAARFLPLGLFRRWEIPIMGHQAELLDYDAGVSKPHIDHRATIRIAPPDSTKTVRYADRTEAGFDPEAVDWDWYFCRGDGTNDGISPEECVLDYKDRDGLKEKTWVWPGSFLDSLRSTSARWARMLGWEKEDLTMWLLTGEPFAWGPLKTKISLKVGRPLTVSLTIHPWMSADTVASNYRKIQRQLFGQENRQLKPRSLAVLRFVEGRIKVSGGVRPSWSSLLDEWNGRCRPEWRYDNRSNLARAYRETLSSVAYPSYILPERRVSSAAQRKAERFNAEATEALTQTMERFIENGYTTSRYDLRGNLLSVAEEQPKSSPASGDSGDKD